MDTFITAYICLPIFFVFYLFWKIVKRPKFVRIPDMDFHTGRRELDESQSLLFVFFSITHVYFLVNEEESAKQELPTTFLGKLWDWLSEFTSSF